LTEVGGVPEIVGGWFVVPEPLTVIENAGSAALDAPSLTLMTMFEYVPTVARVAVFESLPVKVENASQLGLFWIENVRVSPSASLAAGLK
jgi:hypothetical protein